MTRTRKTATGNSRGNCSFACPAWMVFLDGRDLLDRPMGNGIISDIEKQNWYEETRNNRRLVQVGVTYQF